MKTYILLFSFLLYIKGVKLQEEYFYCSDGQKLEAKFECDGISQCEDGTDEDPDICDSSNDLFRCDTPGESVPSSKTCDGKEDCSDGSDESLMTCRGHMCQSDQFRCSYGGCINKTQLCDGTMDCKDGSDEQESRCKNSHLKCRLPPKSTTMSYTVIDCEECKPGQLVKSLTALNFTCKSGYSFELHMPHFRATCEDAKWVPEIPTCREKYKIIGRSSNFTEEGLCPPITSYGGNVECQTGPDNRQECNKPVMPGTRATILCKQYYNLKGSNTAVCQENGKWNNELTCEPSCYRRKEIALVIFGTVINKNRKLYPWVAGLYGLQDNRWEYQCGSTLISDSVVMTAAHCVWMKKPEKVKVVLGKVYRDYYKYEPNQQSFYVKDIEILSVYQDRNGNYGSDIALLILSTRVRLTDDIHPACIEWDKEDSEKITSPGTQGLVAGWGYTETDNPSDELRFIKIPIVDSKKCIDEEPVEFQKFITYTSFCAGYQNGTSVCNGDSGSGLMFQWNNMWYIEGLVSISPRRTNGFLCEPKLFSVFTKVELYKPWIQKILRKTN